LYLRFFALERLKMSWTIYGILFVFGAFVLLMIFNPRLSCFGKRIASPLYPLMRKKRMREVQTEDYGFQLSEGARKQNARASSGNTEGIKSRESDAKKPVKPLKTVDYGFHLIEKKEKDKQAPGGRLTDIEGS